MARKYIISLEQSKEIKEYRKGVTDKYLDRRLHAIQLFGEGMKAKEIAEKLDADKRQISMWQLNFANASVYRETLNNSPPTSPNHSEK